MSIRPAPTKLSGFPRSRVIISKQEFSHPGPLLASLLLSSVLLCACGSGMQGATDPITVSITNAPSSLQIGATVGINAVVTNDPKNGGVTWGCSPANSCGSFNPTQTASGNVTTYTAPAAEPTGDTVVITATSVTDTSKTASASISIASGPPGPMAAGTYVFYVTGFDGNFQTGSSSALSDYAYVTAGVLQIDQYGNILGGEEDYNNGNTENSSGTVVSGSLTNSQVYGTNLEFMSTPGNPLQTIGNNEGGPITVVNQRHAVFTEWLENGLGPFAETASGTLDYQTPGVGLSQLAGGWSFAAKGQKNGATYSQGGVFTLAAPSQSAVCPSTTTPCSAVTNLVTDYDQISGGTGTVVLGDGNQTGGYFSAPDQLGRGQAFFGGIYWDYYVIGPKAIRLLGYNPQTGTYNEVYFGSAYSQGTTASFTGPFVFSDAGSTLTPGYGAAGQISFNGGSVTGYADVSETSGTVTSAAFTGTYQPNISVSLNGQAAAPVNGYGRITITPGSTEDVSVLGVYAVGPTLNILDPNDTTGAGQGALVVDLDQKLTGDGVLLAQSATSPPEGNYGISTQMFGANSSFMIDGELDLLGQLTVNDGAVTGTIDVNDWIGTTSLSTGISVSTTLAADGSHPGRFTTPLSLSLMGHSFSATPPYSPNLNLVFYEASASQLIEFNSGTGGLAGTGAMQLQAQQ